MHCTKKGGKKFTQIVKSIIFFAVKSLFLSLCAAFLKVRSKSNVMMTWTNWLVDRESLFQSRMNHAVVYALGCTCVQYNRIDFSRILPGKVLPTGLIQVFVRFDTEIQGDWKKQGSLSLNKAAGRLPLRSALNTSQEGRQPRRWLWKAALQLHRLGMVKWTRRLKHSHCRNITSPHR